MHDTWQVLRWLWSAILIAYVILQAVASGRLRGQAKRRSARIFGMILVLYAIRTLIRYFLGAGVVYRFSVLVVGLTAGIAALMLISALITQKGDDTVVEADGDAKERIQSLKLS